MRIQLLFLLVFCNALAQGQEIFQVKGTVSSQNILLKNVEIINRNTQQIVITDEAGHFSIAAKNDDKLVFFSSDYDVYNLTVSKDAHFQKNVAVFMSKKPIQIDEVVVEQNAKWSADYMDKILNKQYVADGQTSPENTMVYDGQTMGMDFIAVGKLVKKLFKKREKRKESEPPPVFYDYVTSSFSTDFFVKTLKLPEDEIAIFLEFCMADPKSEKLSSANYLDAMDFLMAKSAEFKKNNSVLNSQNPKQ